MLPDEEALSLFLDLNLTKDQYNILRTVINKYHKDFVPSYYKLQSVKKLYLIEPNIISESRVELNLQNLLNKTVDSIVKTNKDRLKTNKDGLSSNLTLECKWGMDGSSGHSRYKQVFQTEH